MPLRHANFCSIELGAAGLRRSFHIDAFLEGSASSSATAAPRIVRLVGSCDFDTVADPTRPPAWRCDFTSYRFDSGLRERGEPPKLEPTGRIGLPLELSHDLRGWPGAADWFGRKPAPVIEGDRDFCSTT